jgi:charged multivesicular body protein 5
VRESKEGHRPARAAEQRQGAASTAAGMNRFLGSSKPKAPAPTLGDQQGLQQKRIDDLQGRVRKLDSELVKYREQLKKTRPGTSAHNSVKRRAMQLMKQRKMYDQQLGQMMDMEFNMSSVMMAQETIESTVATVSAMKETAKTMKKAQKAGKLDIDSIEKLQDELTDMMEDANEIQEVLGQSYGMPDDCDEDSLMAELDMLEEDMMTEDLLGDSMPDVPDYVAGAAPAEGGSEQEDLAALEAQMAV